MSVKMSLTTKKEEHLSKLVALMRDATERPTVQMVNQMIHEGQYPFANTLSADFGTFEAAVDYAENELKKQGWTPLWERVVAGPRCSLKPRVILSSNSTQKLGLVVPKITTVKEKREKQQTAKKQKIMNFLVDMVVRHQAIPSSDQIESEAFFSTEEVLSYFANGHGMSGVYGELKIQLRERGIDPNQFEWPKPKEKKRFRCKKNGTIQLGEAPETKNSELDALEREEGMELKAAKETNFTESERYYLDVLIDACKRSEGDVLILPTRRQIEKDSFINSKELLKVLGKNGGWDNVIRILKQELTRQGIKYLEPGAKGSVPKSSGKKKPKAQIVQSESDVQRSGEVQRELKLQSEIGVKRASNVQRDSEVQSENLQDGLNLPTTSETKSDSMEEMQIVNSVKHENEPKKRGRKPQAFNREEEIAKLCHYRELLGGKNPTPGRLQKLAKDHSPGEITSAVTFERRLGCSYKEWPKLMDEYLAKHSET